MNVVEDYSNKKVLVLGLAKSGMSAARLLAQLGAHVTVNDSKKFEDNSEAQSLLSEGITVITGSHPLELLDEGFSLIVKNPGIPYSSPFLKEALKRQIPIITEVELAYEISESIIVGITGTNGKTTTTTMIAEILNQEFQATDRHAYLAGNIGFPASTVAQKSRENDVMVTELSSFQLLGTKKFHPKIAVLLNLYEAHLDYHGDRANYVLAKWQIQKNMSAEDYCVLNFDQEELRLMTQLTHATVVPFSTKMVLKEGAYLKEGYCYFGSEKIMATSELGVPGKHNIENALAAIAVAKLLHCSSETIQIALSHFTGVKHRTQFVGTIANRKFYNDSKATNILATQTALSGFANEQLILLAGGLDRGNSFDELIPDLKGIKEIILFGETKEKLKDAAHKAGIQKIQTANNVSEATKLAYQTSEDGDTILLSPACASWDQYPNFEVRGDEFIDTFEQLKLEK